MSKTTPNLFLMIASGLPASGKSTEIENKIAPQLTAANGFPTVIISSDALIERKAREMGKSYDEIFSTYASWADRECKLTFDQCVADGNFNIIVDRTNLNDKSKNMWINRMGEIYLEQFTVMIAEFQVPEDKMEEWEKRLNNREGKTIPKEVVDRMVQTQKPYGGLYPCVKYNTFA